MGRDEAGTASRAGAGTPEGVQTWDPHKYAANARYVADLGAPLVDLLAPRPGERVLDLGCGDGHLTLELARRGCRVLGVDSSRPQIDMARRRGLEAAVLDARRLGFRACFDAVFSNATLHWVKDADDAIAAVREALRPGGRFVAEFGGHGNVARIREGLGRALERRGVDAEACNPWYFPAAEEYRARLLAGGFEVESLVHFKRPTPLPGALRGWLETFGHCFLAPVPEGEREAFLDEVEADCRPDLCDALGTWTADYTRLRFVARKPR